MERRPLEIVNLYSTVSNRDKQTVLSHQNFSDILDNNKYSRIALLCLFSLSNHILICSHPWTCRLALLTASLCFNETFICTLGFLVFFFFKIYFNNWTVWECI